MITVEIELNCGVTLTKTFDDLSIKEAEECQARFNNKHFSDGTPKSDLAKGKAELIFDLSDEYITSSF